MQIFKELKILTARPKRIDLKNIKHHLYGFKSVKDNYSAGNWLKDAKKKLIILRKKTKFQFLWAALVCILKHLLMALLKSQISH